MRFQVFSDGGCPQIFRILLQQNQNHAATKHTLQYSGGLFPSWLGFFEGQSRLFIGRLTWPQQEIVHGTIIGCTRNLSAAQGVLAGTFYSREWPGQNSCHMQEVDLIRVRTHM